MFVEIVGNHNRYQLGNTGQEQICMECFFILCFTSCHTKTILEMVDCFFHIYPDFVCVIPFLCATGSAGISPKVLLGIDIEHAPAGRICTRGFAFTDPFGFFC